MLALIHMGHVYSPLGHSSGVGTGCLLGSFLSVLPVSSFLYSQVLLLVNGLRVDTLLLEGLITCHDCLMLAALNKAVADLFYQQTIRFGVYAFRLESCLQYLVALCLWEGHGSNLNLGFLAWKMQIMVRANM